MAKHMMEAQEAATWLHISYYTLLQKAKKGEIPCVRIGSRVLFSQEGLETWIEEQEAASIKPTHADQGYGKLRKIIG
ncbi:MAG: helix-turn-helix domain-containing protein [Syntrophomonadaceae bacterium]|nr:helix-turn-helix domain-containing protein [Syntrophomonadaceae bacterium]